MKWGVRGYLLSVNNFLISVVIRSLPILFFSILFLSGCHTEVIKEPRPEDVALQRLEGTWRVENVTLDGVIQDSYKDFTLTFSRKENEDLTFFTTTNRPSDADFPETGSFKFGLNVETDLLEQSEGWNMTYWIEDSQLQMIFIASPRDTPHEEGEPMIFPIPTWVFRLKR